MSALPPKLKLPPPKKKLTILATYLYCLCENAGTGHARPIF